MSAAACAPAGDGEAGPMAEPAGGVGGAGDAGRGGPTGACVGPMSATGSSTPAAGCASGTPTSGSLVMASIAVGPSAAAPGAALPRSAPFGTCTEITKNIRHSSPLKGDDSGWWHYIEDQREMGWQRLSIVRV